MKNINFVNLDLFEKIGSELNLISGFYSSYHKQLMLFDHIREVNLLYEKHKLKQITKHELNKELIDLFIILLITSVDEGLLKERLNKFINKNVGGIYNEE